jgi:methylenetetrahydrofolate dehydrogenase (NADP+)/methenyltetrahydrofolate cyclohydrolase
MLVGKPLAALLLARHATVTLCHSRTRDLAGEIARADVVVAAAGRAGLVRGEWVREGSVVIDVGMNRGPDGRLCGDVEFVGALERARFVTPVPGGVGPMTVAMLLANTVQAAEAAGAPGT